MMDFTEYKDIWVFIETDGGKAASVGLELLNPAAQLINNRITRRPEKSSGGEIHIAGHRSP